MSELYQVNVHNTVADKRGFPCELVEESHQCRQWTLFVYVTAAEHQAVMQRFDDCTWEDIKADHVKVLYMILENMGTALCQQHQPEEFE